RRLPPDPTVFPGKRILRTPAAFVKPKPGRRAATHGDSLSALQRRFFAENRSPMSEISKAYEPGSVEKKWYARWLADGSFVADPASARPAYSIVIPPPNVTGVLTLGHVLNNTLQDVLARRARMLGREVLWLPG